MKDLSQTAPAFFRAEDCDLNDLKALCEQTLSISDVPHAAAVDQNVAIYEARALRPALSDTAARPHLLAEWAHLLRWSAGVFVIKGAYADTAPIDRATEIYMQIIADEKDGHTAADHFAAAGSNDRVWNSLQKLCEADPEIFARYFGNVNIDAACEAWLGPNYQMTAQVNLVHPGGAAQQAHRDYHLGFQTADISARYPAHVHDLSPVMTLQGGIAHCDMPVESGPTKLLPFSQAYRAGYAAYRLPAFRDYFEENFVQLPLEKGDAIFFNPALFHAAGANRTADQERFVNLVQVSSAFGRSLEAINRDRMCRLLYPVLHKGISGISAEEIDAAISATAEGYPFPTNLDRDPPVGGLAPESQAALFRRALSEGMSPAAFNAALDAKALKQTV
ncbi:phytanoyl-CoA dioxygenase [Loktanella sp. IMCC34160]|uniref:phytanoyl-CoA dioxygenase family protein n=1 Tax=Loktanella sp. IMCC34160 TaxID=2510646 RepID=UPI00101DD957|nr:phytanoyl-CoA dioxygenase family protein [Loktanella sp. IMCC34160]RYG91985.1 phytanoyl-CoA dioxygenase [Loktanella sp. IMCC34160]